MLEFTGGHLTYDSRRDKTINPEEVFGEFRELPDHSATADAYVRSIGTAVEKEAAITDTSGAFAQELLRYPLTTGNIEHRGRNGDRITLHRYKYTREETQTAHEDIGLLVVDRFRDERKFSFDISKPVNDGPNAISAQTGYGSILYFRQDANQGWHLNNATAPYDDPTYALERMHEVTWAMAGYGPDVRHGFELVRDSVASITASALEIFARESRKHPHTHIQTTLDGKAYSTAASAYNKPAGLHVINISEGESPYITGYDTDSIHVELNPEARTLQITTHTGDLHKETNAFTVAYHQENGYDARQQYLMRNRTSQLRFHYPY